MLRRKISLILTLFFLQIFLSCSTEKPPTYILHNGNIFTSDPNNLWIEALAIQEHKIIATGKTKEILKLSGTNTKVIDLKGHTVIPGINDAHLHISSSFERHWIKFSKNDPSLSEVIGSLEELANKIPAGTWISGSIGGSVLSNPKTTRFILDKILPNNPVMLSGWTGHGRICNSLALEKLNISEKQNDPFGGWYERLKRNDELSGVFHGYAGFRANIQRTRPPDSISVKYFKNYLQNLTSYGITSIQQMSYPYSVNKTLKVLEKIDLPIRWRIIHFPLNLLSEEDINLIKKENVQSMPLVKLSGIKWIMDGTPEERMMVLRESYADSSEWYGRFYISKEQMRQAINATRKCEQQLIVHAVGDKTIETLLSLMDEFKDGNNWKKLRPRIEHGDGLTSDLIKQAQELGVIIVQNPSHLTIKDLVTSRIREETLNSFQPLKSLLNSNIPLAFGSDGPLNPYLNIMFALTDPINPSEALTIEQAVMAYTVGSAFAEYEENEKGTLAPKMLADLAVLSQDIFTIPVRNLPGTKSILTMVGGKIVYKTDSLLIGN